MLANQQQTNQIMQGLAVGRIIELETALAQSRAQAETLAGRVQELEAQAAASAEAAGVPGTIGEPETGSDADA